MEYPHFHEEPQAGWFLSTIHILQQKGVCKFTIDTKLEHVGGVSCWKCLLQVTSPDDFPHKLIFRTLEKEKEREKEEENEEGEEEEEQQQNHYLYPTKDEGKRQLCDLFLQHLRKYHSFQKKEGSQDFWNVIRKQSLLWENCQHCLAPHMMPHDSLPHDSPSHDSPSHDSSSHDSLPHDSLPHDSLPHDSLPHDPPPHDFLPNLIPPNPPLRIKTISHDPNYLTFCLSSEMIQRNSDSIQGPIETKKKGVKKWMLSEIQLLISAFLNTDSKFLGLKILLGATPSRAEGLFPSHYSFDGITFPFETLKELDLWLGGGLDQCTSSFYPPLPAKLSSHSHLSIPFHHEIFVENLNQNGKPLGVYFCENTPSPPTAYHFGEDYSSPQPLTAEDIYKRFRETQRSIHDQLRGQLLPLLSRSLSCPVSAPPRSSDFDFSGIQVKVRMKGSCAKEGHIHVPHAQFIQFVIDTHLFLIEETFGTKDELFLCQLELALREDESEIDQVEGQMTFTAWGKSKKEARRKVFERASGVIIQTYEQLQKVKKSFLSHFSTSQPLPDKSHLVQWSTCCSECPVCRTVWEKFFRTSLPPLRSKLVKGYPFRQGESQTIEFKDYDFGKLKGQKQSATITEVMKNATAFLNSFGGSLYFGITDEGTIKGITLKEPLLTCENLEQKILAPALEKVFPPVPDNFYQSTFHILVDEAGHPTNSVVWEIEFFQPVSENLIFFCGSDPPVAYKRYQAGKRPLGAARIWRVMEKGVVALRDEMISMVQLLSQMVGECQLSKKRKKRLDD